MPVVHLDANCHPGRARPDNVVARNQVTDVRFGSLADIGEGYQGCPLYPSEADILSVGIDVRYVP